MKQPKRWRKRHACQIVETAKHADQYVQGKRQVTGTAKEMT